MWIRRLLLLRRRWRRLLLLHHPRRQRWRLRKLTRGAIFAFATIERTTAASWHVVASHAIGVGESQFLSVTFWAIRQL